MTSVVKTEARCLAITKNGKGPQCTRPAETGSRYCWQHRGYTGPSVAPVSVVPVPVSITPREKPVLVNVAEVKQHSPVRIISPNPIYVQSPEVVEVKQYSPRVVVSRVSPVSPVSIVSPRTVLSHVSPKAVVVVPSGYLKTELLPISVPLDGSLYDMEEDASFDLDPSANTVWGHGPFKVELELEVANNKVTVDFNEDRDYTLRQIIDALNDVYNRPVSLQYLRDALARAKYEDQEELLNLFIADVEKGNIVPFYELNAGDVFLEKFEQIIPGVYNAVLGS
jgi:hypothetical protein